VKLEVGKITKITNQKRIVMALIGGALFGFGSQLGADVPAVQHSQVWP
jgi:hypothetical protein